MSKRYGRNQRRAHRAKIVELEATRQADEALLRHAAARLQKAESAIDFARSVLCDSVALPPEHRGAHPHGNGDFRVATRLPFSDGSPIGELRYHHLHELVARVEGDWRKMGIHCRVDLADGHAAYFIDSIALRSMPEHALVETLAREIAPLLAQHLTNYFRRSE